MMIQTTFLIQVPLECSDSTKLQRITPTEFVESEFEVPKSLGSLSSQKENQLQSAPISAKGTKDLMPLPFELFFSYYPCFFC